MKPTPTALAQSNCTEAARAAALASHSAAGLAAAAGLREAARLLRSAEALARAATAALLAHRFDARDPGAGAGVAASKQRRPRKKKSMQDQMECADEISEVLPTADGVPEAACASPASTLSPAAADFVPGQATRVLAAKVSRERSPHRLAAGLSIPPTRKSSSSSVGPPAFSVGQAVLLSGLVARPDLVGRSGVVKSFDGSTLRYVVALDATSETVRVQEKNVRAKIL